MPNSGHKAGTVSSDHLREDTVGRSVGQPLCVGRGRQNVGCTAHRSWCVENISYGCSDDSRGSVTTRKYSCLENVLTFKDNVEDIKNIEMH